ncbi:MAG: helix-turn-helix domain-containing protein [Bacteroidota bacterium]
MLFFNLTEIFRARNIDRPYSFLVKNGFTPHTATSLIQNTLRTVRMDHVEKLCRVLNCEPYDFMYWKPDKNFPLPDSHPLYHLRKSSQQFNWKQIFSSIPLDQLKKLSKDLTENKPPELKRDGIE